jgi:hypothetical protein
MNDLWFIYLGVVNASESPFDPSEDLPTYTGNADDDPLERRSYMSRPDGEEDIISWNVVIN